MTSLLESNLRSKYLPKLTREDDSGGDSSSDDEAKITEGKRPLFVIDAKPSEGNEEKKTIKKKANAPLSTVHKFSSSLQPHIDTTGYIPNKVSGVLKLLHGSKEAEHIFATKSVIRPGFERDDEALPFRMSQRQRKKLNKADREKTAGEKWFNMPAAELTDEVKQDISLLQMRDALDPKRFYKRNSDLKHIPKYFQIGTVVGTSADYYNSLPKKERKNKLVDELLADAKLKQWSKKKYAEIIKKNPYHLRQQRRASRKQNKDLHQRDKASRKEERQNKKAAKREKREGFDG